MASDQPYTLHELELEGCSGMQRIDVSPRWALWPAVKRALTYFSYEHKDCVVNAPHAFKKTRVGSKAEEGTRKKGAGGGRESHHKSL